MTSPIDLWCFYTSLYLSDYLLRRTKQCLFTWKKDQGKRENEINVCFQTKRTESKTCLVFLWFSPQAISLFFR